MNTGQSNTRQKATPAVAVHISPLTLILFGLALWGFILIGLLTAIIPPAFLGWAESGPLTALIIIAGMIVLTLTDENVLEPSCTGKKLQLSSAFVFISFFFWGWLLGAMGALLSYAYHRSAPTCLKHQR